MLLIGNKNDLASQRQVPCETGLDFSKKNSMFFFEISAKVNSGKTVKKAIDVLISEIVSFTKIRFIEDRTDNLLKVQKKTMKLQTKKIEDKGCC